MKLTDMAPLVRPKHWMRLTLTVCSPTLACSAPVFMKMSNAMRHAMIAAQTIYRHTTMLR
jgi:hypothetical protein